MLYHAIDLKYNINTKVIKVKYKVEIWKSIVESLSHLPPSRIRADIDIFYNVCSRYHLDSCTMVLFIDQLSSAGSSFCDYKVILDDKILYHICIYALKCKSELFGKHL